MGTIEAYGTNIINSKGEGYTQITWDDWNALTPSEQAAIPRAIITDVPGASGSISAELLKTLWTNPSPSADFAAEQVNLSSSDYDFLMICFRQTKTSNYYLSVITEKGATGAFLGYAHTTGTVPLNAYRTATYTNSTTVTFSDAQNVRHDSASAATQNNYIIPTQIYGIKKSISFDLTAVVANVSTDASKCMLSDGETSVETKFGSVDTDIANRLPVYRATAAGNVPTTTEVLSTLQSLGNKQSFVVNFYNSADTLLLSSMYYCQTNTSYGAGILVSHYGYSFYKVKNSNGTVTLTQF